MNIGRVSKHGRVRNSMDFHLFFLLFSFMPPPPILYRWFFIFNFHSQKKRKKNCDFPFLGFGFIRLVQWKEWFIFKFFVRFILLRHSFLSLSLFVFLFFSSISRWEWTVFTLWNTCREISSFFFSIEQYRIPWCKCHTHNSSLSLSHFFPSFLMKCEQYSFSTYSMIGIFRRIPHVFSWILMFKNKKFCQPRRLSPFFFFFIYFVCVCSPSVFHSFHDRNFLPFFFLNVVKLHSAIHPSIEMTVMPDDDDDDVIDVPFLFDNTLIKMKYIVKPLRNK